MTLELQEPRLLTGHRLIQIQATGPGTRIELCSIPIVDFFGAWRCSWCCVCFTDLHLLPSAGPGYFAMDLFVCRQTVKRKVSFRRQNHLGRLKSSKLPRYQQRGSIAGRCSQITIQTNMDLTPANQSAMQISSSNQESQNLEGSGTETQSEITGSTVQNSVRPKKPRLMKGLTVEEAMANGIKLVVPYRFRDDLSVQGVPLRSSSAKKAPLSADAIYNIELDILYSANEVLQNKLDRVLNGQSQHAGKSTKLEYDAKKIAEHWGISERGLHRIRSAMSTTPVDIHQVDQKAPQGRKKEISKIDVSSDNASLK